MGFRAEHISPAELASIRRGRRAHFSLMVHVAECSQCKLQLADSLILSQLMQKGGVAQRPHLPDSAIDRYHASAYEGADADPNAFFAAHEHLQRCDQCFAKFLHVHEQLSPSKVLLERIAKTGPRMLPKRSLGALVLQKAFDSVTAAFRPRKGDLEQQGETLRDLLRMGTVAESSGPAYESPSKDLAFYADLRPLGSASESAPARDAKSLFAALSVPAAAKRSLARLSVDPGNIRAGDVLLRASSRLSQGRLHLDLSAVDMIHARPASDVELQELDETGSVLHSGRTDAHGNISLEVAPACERLTIRIGESEPWEIRLDIREESPRARRARIRTAEDAALKEKRSRETEERKVHRAANEKNREEVLAQFRTLSPEEQLKAAARDKTRPIFFYQQDFPTLDNTLLDRLGLDVLQDLRTRLAPVRRGPLVSARASLDAYLADRGQNNK